MSSSPINFSPELRLRIEEVAIQLRRRRWIRNWIRFGATTLALTVAFSFALYFNESLRLSRNAILLIFLACEALNAFSAMWTPLRRPIQPRQVALFIDEHYPELQNRIITAVELGSRPPAGESAWMVEQLLTESRSMIRRIGMMEVVSPGLLAQLVFIAGFFLLMSAAVMLARVDLWLPSIRLARTASGPKFVSADFAVEPGDARVRNGDNQVILVKSEILGRPVGIRYRSGVQAWTEEAMAQGSTEKVHHHQFFRLAADVEYQIRFGDQISPIYALRVWTPPETVAIDLSYRYPEYLGWAPREAPNGGNISAIEGSKVELRAKTNKAVAKAEMVYESGARVPLRKELDTTWVTEIEVTKEDKYHIELADLEGQPSLYNPTYDIAVQRDNPPQVKIEFPRGDGEVSLLDEAPFSFQVTDDFGVASYGLQVEVVGREKSRIELASAPTGGTPLLEAAGEKTLMLEDLGLKEGDLITWTVYAKDQKPNRAAQDELSDIYFLEVRPFEKEYREAISGAGMQGMGQDKDVADQKEIIIATQRLMREAAQLADDEFARRQETIQKAQTEALMKYSSGQVKAADKQEILDLLIAEANKGLEALTKAAKPEPAAELSIAIEHMRNAYQALIRLKPRQADVAQSNQQGQGQGNSPDVDQLEMDREKNTYENEKRTQEKQESAEKTMSGLKELAKRQDLINEEIARLISEMASAKTEQEKRELERQLERLKQEQKSNMEKLDQLQQEVGKSSLDPRQTSDTTQGLDNARKQMNESLERLQKGELQQARSSGARAADKLQNLAKQLESLSRGAAGERMKQLQERFERVGKDQTQLRDNLSALRDKFEAGSNGPPAELDKAREELMKQKTDLSETFKGLMEEASVLSEKSSESQELMSRKLGDWLRKTSADGIFEDMKESEPMVRYGVWESAEQKEKGIGEKLDRANERLKAVADAMTRDDLEAMRKALAELEKTLDPGELGKGANDKNASDKKVASADATDKAGDKAGDNSGKDDPARTGVNGDDAGTTGGASSGRPNAKDGADSAAGPKDDLQSRINEARRAVVVDRDAARAATAREKAAEAIRGMGADPAGADQPKSVQDLARGVGVNPDDPKAMKEFRDALAQAMREASGQPGKPGEKGQGEKPGELGKGDKPGDSGEPSEAAGGDQAGDKPGDKPGDGSSDQPGDQPGGKDGSGKAPGKDASGKDASGKDDAEPASAGEPGGKPGSQPGGDQPGGDQASGDQAGGDSSNPAPGSKNSGRTPDATRNASPSMTGRSAGRGAAPPGVPFDPSRRGPNSAKYDGGLENWTHPPKPDFNANFFKGDADKWVESLRDAEALLPKDSDERRRLERARERIQSMRAEFKRQSLAPKYELLLSDVIRPIAETAGELKNEILKALKEKEFALTNDGEAPAQYTRRVSEYFEALSAGERRP